MWGNRRNIAKSIDYWGNWIRQHKKTLAYKGKNNTVVYTPHGYAHILMGVWAICREFWGNNEAPLNIENYDVKDLDAAYAKRLLNELESLLDKLGWAKE